MKLPNLAIIFIVIILPLSVVLSTYMQLQLEVLNTKNEYSTKLLDAAYDGILSFELNSLSIDNAAGQSVKSYVSNAVSAFFTSMAMNMGSSGASKINLQSYVPAILFTTYDGYYIYSPVKTFTPSLTSDGIAEIDPNDGELIYETKSGGGTTNFSGGTYKPLDDSQVKKVTNYMIKPFIYYSATYASNNSYTVTGSGDYVLVINYSLDNHIALYGNYMDSSGKKRTISKSGYLMDYDRIEISGDFKLLGVANADENKKVRTVSYSKSRDDNFWIPLIENYDANYQDGNIVINDNNTHYKDDTYKEGKFGEYIIRGKGINLYYEMSKYGRDNGGEAIIDYTLKYDEEDPTHNPIKVKVDGIEITDKDAKEYYLKSYFFSKWVEKEFGNKVKISDIKNVYDNGADGEFDWIETETMSKDQGISEYLGNSLILKVRDGGNLVNDPESEASIFTRHKKQVIQNSIQYNLNSAISTYNENQAKTTDFSMPVFTEADWDKVLNKISMAVFMQGVPCGTGTWGDYAIATSSNNKLFVNKSNLYFIKNEKATSDMISEYHSIDCNKLHEQVESNAANEDLTGDMSFEFTYDQEEKNIQLFALQEHNPDSGNFEFKKYYRDADSSGDPVWYYWNGLKVVDSSKVNQLNSGAIEVASLYVDTTDSSIDKMKVLAYYIPGSTNFYEYGKSDKGFFKVIKNMNPLFFVNKNDDEQSYEDKVQEDVILYDHMNVGCYWCMMTNSYEEYDFRKYLEDGRCPLNPSVSNCSACKKIAKAWYTYIAKYRVNQFKMTDSIHR